MRRRYSWRGHVQVAGPCGTLSAVESYESTSWLRSRWYISAVLPWTLTPTDIQAWHLRRDSGRLSRQQHVCDRVRLPTPISRRGEHIALSRHFTRLQGECRSFLRHPISGRVATHQMGSPRRGYMRHLTPGLCCTSSLAALMALYRAMDVNDEMLNASSLTGSRAFLAAHQSLQCVQARGRQQSLHPQVSASLHQSPHRK